MTLQRCRHISVFDSPRARQGAVVPGGSSSFRAINEYVGYCLFYWQVSIRLVYYNLAVALGRYLHSELYDYHVSENGCGLELLIPCILPALYILYRCYE